MDKHELKILSLHDAQAVCTCGHWSITCTGERTREYLQEEFGRHHAVEKPDLYKKLQQAGCELDSHESDLYVKATETSFKILKEHFNNDLRAGNVTDFWHQETRQRWFEIPFHYTPWWNKRGMR